MSAVSEQQIVLDGFSFPTSIPFFSCSGRKEHNGITLENFKLCFFLPYCVTPFYSFLNCTKQTCFKTTCSLKHHCSGYTGQQTLRVSTGITHICFHFQTPSTILYSFIQHTQWTSYPQQTWPTATLYDLNRPMNRSMSSA